MYDIVEKLEESRRKHLELHKLNYSNTSLNPSLSKEAMELHYNTLAKGYVDRYNKGEGDKDFNEAGAFLHNLYFAQFREPQDSNKPNGPVLTLIKQKYGWWQDFKEKFKEEAMKIQGSGWIYLSFSGEIKIIPNHEIRDDILILIDWWEHAWIVDYQTDKKQYLENQWKIMNWVHINTRWGKNL